jgi:hypothetical protein
MKSRVRILSSVAVVVLLVSLAGCAPPSQASAPLASGQIVLCTLGDKPVMRAGETGSWSSQDFAQGRVDIYERVIIITETNGTKHCAPHDWFKAVIFK